MTPRLGGVFREAFLSWLFPEACQICEEEAASPDDGYVCRRCQDQVRWITGPCCDRCGLPFEAGTQAVFECSNCRDLPLRFRSARSVLAATGVCRDLIHRYKYERALWFEPLLARWLCTVAGPALIGQGWDAIVPVPLHPLKEREREFNQSSRLGSHLSQATGIPLVSTWIQRHQSTHTQTTLTRKERNENVRKAFLPWNEMPASIKKVVVFDDVLTTGATASACAEVLRRGGVEEVVVWTLARGV